MTYDEICEQIQIEMNIRCDKQWDEILGNAVPAPYSVEDIEFEIPIGGIVANIGKGTFTFKDGTLSFSARLGSSNEEQGSDIKRAIVVSGHGSFEFASSASIKVSSFRINGHIDLL